MANPLAVQDVQAFLPEKKSCIEEHTTEILSCYQGTKDELIPILQQVQQVFGYLPEPAMEKIAKFLKIPETTVFSVGTFYAQFKLTPTGRNIVKICRGTACHIKGGARILTEVEKRLGIATGETTPDLEHSIETTACFGACALAPVLVINDKVYGRVTVQEVEDILNTIDGANESGD